MKQLTQKSWFSKKIITIGIDSLTVQTKDIRENLEYKIKFSELGFDTLKKQDKTANISLIAFIAFDLLFMGLIAYSIIDNEPIIRQFFWVGGLLFFLAITIITLSDINKNLVYLTGGDRSLELIADKPTEESVILFIEEIHRAMRQCLKDKFTRFDSTTPYEIKAGQLDWLKDQKIITGEEYEQMIEKYKTDRIIGFTRDDEE